MVDVRHIFDVLGRKNVKTRLGVGYSSISAAAVENVMPAKWWVVISSMCLEANVDCPQHLFSFSEDIRLRDGKASLTEIVDDDEGTAA